MFTEGQIVALRRYKDLCCEFKRKLNGSIIEDCVFFFEMQQYCGHSYIITEVFGHTSPTYYTLSLPHNKAYRNWRLDERFIEVINNGRGDSIEVD